MKCMMLWAESLGRSQFTSFNSDLFKIKAAWLAEKLIFPMTAAGTVCDIVFYYIYAARFGGLNSEEIDN